jgi:hypothetical protein
MHTVEFPTEKALNMSIKGGFNSAHDGTQSYLSGIG